MCVSCISGLLLWPGQGFGSPASALREYQAGKYEEALKEYERLLQGKSDDPRLHFNAGAAAYRNQQFEEAAKQFNRALATPDLKLQEQAYFNRGNTLYWLGEGNPDPNKRTENWEKSLKDFESAGKLNQQDADAKYNYEFVKRKLEELKQQQQQSQQNKQDQKQNQDQQQQNQQKQDDQKKDNEQQQQAQQDQSEQKKDSSQQEQQAQQKKQEEQQQAASQSQEQKEKQAQEQQQQVQQSPGQPKDKLDEKEQEAAAAQATGQMTPEQARQLLDTQKGDEQMLPIKPTGKPVDRSRPIKDW